MGINILSTELRLENQNGNFIENCFRSFASESSHKIAGLPIRQVPLVYVEITDCKGSAPAI
jgi:hypothetical protein